jgi:RHS repeat-associated protein
LALVFCQDGLYNRTRILAFINARAERWELSITVCEQPSDPYGETRYATGSLFTDRLFTGQQAIASLGLYFYKARYYSPTLGRFLSADTLTPGGPEGLNRYAYVENDPINHSDPSGHMACDMVDGNGKCIVHPGGGLKGDYNLNPGSYGLTSSGWSSSNERTIMLEAAQIANRMFEAYSSFCVVNNRYIHCKSFSNPASLFKKIFNGLVVNYNSGHKYVACDSLSGPINCGAWAGSMLTGLLEHQITHEFGHQFNLKIGNGVSELHDATIITSLGDYVSGWTAATGYQRTSAGYKCAFQPCVQHAWTFLDGSTDPMGYTVDEDYADMWMNWVWNDFASNYAGQARYSWMDARVGRWIFGYLFGK